MASGASGAREAAGASIAFSGVRFKAGLLSEGTAQAPSSPERTALASTQGVPPPHPREVATDVTAADKPRRPRGRSVVLVIVIVIVIVHVLGRDVGWAREANPRNLGSTDEYVHDHDHVYDGPTWLRDWSLGSGSRLSPG